MGEEQEMKLLGAWASPFVLRVKWALNLKGVQYEYLEEDVFNKSPLLIQSNPVHKKVPVLLHSSKPICESLVIIEYLDETWKEKPLLPEDPYERAVARFWAKFVDEKFTEVIRNVIVCDGEQLENEVKQAKQALEILEGEIEGKKFFGGETLGLVDIVFGFTPIWLIAIEEVCGVKFFDPAQYPCLEKWMEDFLKLPLIRESNLPARENLVQYLTNVRQYALTMAAKK